MNYSYRKYEFKMDELKYQYIGYQNFPGIEKLYLESLLFVQKFYIVLLIF